MEQKISSTIGYLKPPSDYSANQYLVMKKHTVTGQFILAGANGNPIGILIDEPNAATQPGTIAGTDGDLVPCYAGDTVAEGDELISDTNSKVVPVASTANANIVGICMKAASADELTMVLIKKYFKEAD